MSASRRHASRMRSPQSHRSRPGAADDQRAVRSIHRDHRTTQCDDHEAAEPDRVADPADVRPAQRAVHAAAGRGIIRASSESVRIGPIIALTTTRGQADDHLRAAGVRRFRTVYVNQWMMQSCVWGCGCSDYRGVVVRHSRFDPSTCGRGF